MVSENAYPAVSGACSPAVTPRCPVRTALELVGGKWRLLILQALLRGAARFSDLRRDLPGISEKVLTSELRALADAGLLVRTADAGVLYRATALGAGAAPLIEALARFGLYYTAAVLGNGSMDTASTPQQAPAERL